MGILNLENGITPIEFRDGVFFKREDLFVWHGLNGAKVRAALYLVNQAKLSGYEGVTTVGHRKSPQIHIVGKICKQMDLQFVGHTPTGELPDAFTEYDIRQHKPGYNNVIQSRCTGFARESGYYEIPFGMIKRDCILLTTNQVRNIPKEVKRIVVTIGSGVNLCGILLALRNQHLKIPVLGVVVGRSPVKFLNTYGPFGWRGMVELVNAKVGYATEVKGMKFKGIELDPVYEAKCIPFIQKNDLFWVIGIRNF